MRKTKAEREREAQAAIEQARRISAARRWTDDSDIEPDVPPPSGFNELTTGWVYNAYARRIDVACSSSVSHAIGRTDRTTTQGARALYSTRERALRALRVALERQFAEELAKVDALLERELISV